MALPRYKALAPAPHSPGREREPEPPPPPDRGRKKRQVFQHVACDACRARKVACGGTRPTCTTCVVRQTRCIYRPARALQSSRALEAVDMLQERLNSQDDVFQALRNLPENSALEMLRRIRADFEISGLLTSMSVDHDLSSEQRPSILKAARDASPVQSDIDFELRVLHQHAYPKLPPIDVSLLRRFLEPLVSRIDSQMDILRQSSSDISSRPSPSTTSNTSLGTPRDLDWTFQPQGDAGSTGLHAYDGPAPPRRLCDDRLERLQIDFWSKVPLKNDDAACIISFYLETHHAVFGLFDADLFLEDLVQRRLTFCTPFLVSSLLYLACQAYTTVDLNVAALPPAFFEEAESLSRGEATSDSATAVAAFFVFGVGCNAHGKADVAEQAFRCGRRMAERLGLFGASFDGESAASSMGETAELVRMASHTAWGAFNWLTMSAFFYLEEPVSSPPTFPVPGDDRKLALWKTWPKYMGPTFPVLCRLWTIAQEVAVVYVKHDDGSIHDRVPLSFAEAKYRKLLAWMDTIDADMLREDDVAAHVVMFHILFHVVVAIIFQPFLHEPQAFRLRSFTSADSFPKQIYATTINQLKQLCLLYSRRFREARTMALFNAALVVLSNALLAELRDDNWREYFLLCVYCWRDLYVCYPIFHNIAHGFLTVALQNGCITGLEATAIMAEVRGRGRHHETSHEVNITFACNLDLTMQSSWEATIDVVARNSEDFVVSDQSLAGGSAEQAAGRFMNVTKWHGDMIPTDQSSRPTNMEGTGEDGELS
ncbi:hypothetical protein HIM_00799 [Hirsutella minnesotensis 3608]|nr:hypothetical protein HIM_00799 [Hirsutella minnesotensis 3608]